MCDHITVEGTELVMALVGGVILHWRVLYSESTELVLALIGVIIFQWRVQYSEST